MYGFRVPGRGVVILEKAIAESGRTQAEFFRMAVEALVNDGDVAAAAYHSGEQAGLARAGELLRGGAIANLTALADHLEKKGDSGIESVELAIGDDGDGDGG